MDEIKKALLRTKKAKIKFGKDCEYGYHTHYIDEQELKGQRNTKLRLKKFREHIDFTNKQIVDFGCCTGALLLNLPEIHSGKGFDVDSKYIEAAKLIKKHLKKENITFSVFNLERNLHQLNVDGDIAFCLSLGSWIKNWRKLYSYCHEHFNTLVLETNNEKEGKPQIEYVRNLFGSVELIDGQSLDDRTGNARRQLWVCLK